MDEHCNVYGTLIRLGLWSRDLTGTRGPSSLDDETISTRSRDDLKVTENDDARLMRGTATSFKTPKEKVVLPILQEWRSVYSVFILLQWN